MNSEYFIGRFRAIRYALGGISELLHKEKNTRVYLFFTIAAIIMGIVTHINEVEWLVLILIISAIWSAEAINSAIERTVDLVTLEKKPLAKSAKDLAAGGVLILSIGSVIIGLIIFLPKIYLIFF